MQFAFNKRFNEGDLETLLWARSQNRMLQLLRSSIVLHYLPFLKYLPGDRFKYKELLGAVEEVRAIILRWIEKDKRNINFSDKTFEDVAQAYLTEMERKKIQGVTDTYFDEANLVSNILDFLERGTDITSSTVLSAVLFMVIFPDMQTKLFEEIHDVVGLERPPTLSDKNKLRWMSAFILETQRFANIFPFPLDRVATKDFYVGGFTISKGTVLKVNTDSLHNDKDVWGDPEVFRPDRFLDENGAIEIKKEFFPFGMGKRNCLGEDLAKMELFFFLSALVQKFEFLPEDDWKLPTTGTSPDSGIAPFKIRAIIRKKVV